MTCQQMDGSPDKGLLLLLHGDNHVKLLHHINCYISGWVTVKDQEKGKLGVFPAIIGTSPSPVGIYDVTISNHQI